MPHVTPHTEMVPPSEPRLRGFTSCLRSPFHCFLRSTSPRPDRPATPAGARRAHLPYAAHQRAVCRPRPTSNMHPRMLYILRVSPFSYAGTEDLRALGQNYIRWRRLSLLCAPSRATGDSALRRYTWRHMLYQKTPRATSAQVRGRGKVSYRHRSAVLLA